MASELYYPTDLDPNTIQRLQVIKQLIAEHPDYFDSSPYSQELELKIRQLLGAVGKGGASVFTPSNEELDLLVETTTVYKDLKNHKPSMQDDAARMSYYRTATSLLERLLAATAEAKNQKQMSDFYNTVFLVMEEVMSPAQHTIFIDRMKAFLPEKTSE